MFPCLPLFHANALSLTAAPAMVFGLPFGLEKRFSASRFWEPIRRWGVTSFNALGAMIPILMKQPEHPDDAVNPVRRVVSAACPKNLWREFERRFRDINTVTQQVQGRLAHLENVGFYLRGGEPDLTFA